MTKRELQEKLAGAEMVLGERRVYSTSKSRTWVNGFYAVDQAEFYDDDPAKDWEGRLLAEVPTGGKPNWKKMAEVAGV